MVCFVMIAVFFYFKQKTAYDMRISVWSSDVCSSDLRRWWRMTGSNRRPPACKAGALPAELIPRSDKIVLVGQVGIEPTTPALSRRCSNRLSYLPSVRPKRPTLGRSEERRVGKASGCTCRFRWTPNNKKKINKQ